MNKVEDSTGGVEGDEGEARPFASAAEMAEALAAEPLARDFAASSFGGTMSSSLIATGYTPASALFASFRHSPLRALGVVESPVFREIRAAREARSIISQDLRRLREFRELKSTLELGRSLGLVRSAQRYDAPPAPPPAPPAPPPKDARTLRKERARAAAAKRGEELRAMEPKSMLSRLRTMKKGREPCHVAAHYGMTAAEMRALEQSAKPSAPPRKHRKRA